jgi:hypothetical protein
VRHRGQVVDCQRIKGCLSIEAQDVVIRDVAIACTSGRTGTAANGTAVIKIQDGASADLSRVSINGRRGVHACVWHQGTRLRMSHSACRHVDDGVFSWADTGYSNSTGDHFRILRSYFHDFTTRTANGHIDGYQTEGARHGLLRHNTFRMTSDAGNQTDSAIAIWNSIRSSKDIRVVHNLVEGGGFSVYAEDYSPTEANPKGGNTVERVTFTDNVFSTHLYGCVGRWGVWFTRGAPTDGWRRNGNRVLETRADIDHRNPVNGGTPCT